MQPKIGDRVRIVNIPYVKKLLNGGQSKITFAVPGEDFSLDPKLIFKIFNRCIIIFSFRFHCSHRHDIYLCAIFNQKTSGFFSIANLGKQFYAKKLLFLLFRTILIAKTAGCNNIPTLLEVTPLYCNQNLMREGDLTDFMIYVLELSRYEQRFMDFKSTGTK